MICLGFFWCLGGLIKTHHTGSSHKGPKILHRGKTYVFSLFKCDKELNLLVVSVRLCNKLLWLLFDFGWVLVINSFVCCVDCVR